MANRRILNNALILAFLGLMSSMLLMSGCMLMHGGMGHGSNHGNQPAGKTVIKEVQRDSISITLEVPALMTSKDSPLTVTVKDVATGKPVSDARVSFTIAPRDNQAIEFDVPQSKEKGTYEMKHKFTHSGPHEIVAKVVLDAEGWPPITASVNQDVMQPTEHKSGKFSKPLMILGGIGMGLMMFLMFL